MQAAEERPVPEKKNSTPMHFLRRQLIRNLFYTGRTVILFPEKGPFDQLPIGNPLPTIQGAEMIEGADLTAGLADDQSMSARKRRVPEQWKQLFKPVPLALLGLAIAVALWGFGYKLSLYHLHQTPSVRASFAQLWDNSRNSTLAGTSRTRFVMGSQAHLTPSQPHLDLCRGVAPVLQTPTSGVRHFKSSIPSRAPPAVASA
jgi:hypothetical protein